MTAFATEKQASRPFVGGQTPRFVACGNGQPCPPTHEEIARRAYDIYIAHDRSDGRSDMDWRQAEEELAHAATAARHKNETPFRS
jgi:hypothetical protein